MNVDSRQLALFPMRDTPIPIRVVTQRPPGYRTLGRILEETNKAIRVAYYNWILWIPRKAVRKISRKEIYFAHVWAIESAKSHPSAEEKSP